MQGWLDKKSGGKEGSSKSSWLEKWDKRYFVLVGTQLSYYKHEEDHRKAKEPAGSIECAGAELFLKEVKGQAFRFTIQAKDRELKLRAPNASAYHAWSDALTPLVASTGRDSSVSVDERGALERTTSVAVPSRETDAPPSCSGWLEKKSGGKEGHAKSRLLEKWDRRYFVLLGSEMRYFKGEDDHNKGKAALGSIECAGAKLFLKEVKGTAFRFTVQNQTRELKLRAENASEYQKWTVALGPLVNPHTEELLLTPSERSAEGGGGDSPSAGRSRTNTLDTMANSFLDEMENERQSTSLDLGGAPLDERDEDALDASDDSIDRGSVETASPVLVPSVSFKKVPPSALDSPSRTSLDARLADGDEDEDDEDDESGGGSAPPTQPSNPIESALAALNPFGGGSGEGTPPTSEAKASPSQSSPRRASLADQIVGFFTPRQSMGDGGLGGFNPFGNQDSANGSSGSGSGGGGGGGGGGGASSEANPFGDESTAADSAPPEPPAPANPFGDDEPVTSSPSKATAANPFGDPSQAALTALQDLPPAPPPPAIFKKAAGPANPFGGPEVDDDGFDAAAIAAAAAGMGACVAAAASSSSGEADSNTPAGVASLDESVGAPFKIIIVGDSGVGKTCLLLRFTEGRYDAYQRATVAVDISNAQLDLGSSTVGLALWDTAGQERFASLSAPYFRQADGVVVVFDVGKRSTFERVQSYWMDELFFKADPEVSVLLVGMKADIPEPEREVSDEEAINFAEQSGWLYFSASAKSGLHVRDAFYLLACTVMNRLNESDPKNVLNDSGDAGVDLAKGGGAKKGGCC